MTKHPWIGWLLVAGLLALAGSAFGDPGHPSSSKHKKVPHCWCRIEIDGCNGTNANIFDRKVWGFRSTESGKIGKCADICREQAAAYQGSAELAQLVCANAGPGTHRVQAYSHVGSRQTEECVVRHDYGTVSCPQTCTCPGEICTCPEGFRNRGTECVATCGDAERCCVPNDAQGVTIDDGTVTLEPTCDGPYELFGTQCHGNCVPEEDVTGLAIQDGNVVFDATCRPGEPSWL